MLSFCAGWSGCQCPGGVTLCPGWSGDGFLRGPRHEGVRENGVWGGGEEHWGGNARLVSEGKGRHNDLCLGLLLCLRQNRSIPVSTSSVGKTLICLKITVIL